MAVDPQGAVTAYAWRGAEFWALRHLARGYPDELMLAEVIANGPASADAILHVCRRWAVEEGDQRGRPARAVTLAIPPEGPVAAAARRHAAIFRQQYAACGESMVRVLDAGRLLDAMKPELAARLADAWPSFAGTLRFETDIGSAALVVTPNGVSVQGASDGPHSGAAPDDTLHIRLPQTALGRLALGAFPAGDVIARLDETPSERAAQLVEVRFPLRHPHLYVPDRF